MPTRARSRVIVVGYGMAGHRLVSQLAASPESEAFDVLVIGEEPRPAYDRVHLSDFFAGVTVDDLTLKPEHPGRALGWSERLSTPVVSIDAERREVETPTGRVAYDALVLATGSRPFVPPVPGHDLPGCFVYRTLEDLEAMRTAAEGKKTGIVIGGGLLGLEAANALRNLGLKAHVVELAPHLMPTQVDGPGGRILAAQIEALGIDVHVGARSERIEAREGQLRLELADRPAIDTDLIVFSAGIRPRDELSERTPGLARGPRGGFVIDDHGRTTLPDVYAIGECASHNGILYGLVGPANQMADAVAAQLEGRAASGFRGGAQPTKLKLLGIDVASFGDAHARTEGALSLSLVDEIAGVYKKVVVDRKKRRLLGGILVGDASDFGTLSVMAAEGLPLPSPVEQLVARAPAGSGPLLGPDALPDAAQICTCNGVSAGDLRAAVRDGHHSVPALKACTTAGTGCGGCVPSVTSLLHAELEKAGVTIDRSLCEHFAYTRQELYEIVRVRGIRTFDELLRAHGRGGRGCEICKPAVASILASSWNDFVLESQHAPLQDTNDYYLANMQRDGTYSVIPRVPGGEITPKKLAAIAAVAEKFDLYTKITGAQRIDLFGAQLHELPAIWRELVEAGFESGHAYGKALRTVKSCVGDTWCRYGVQDSVGFAIRLEERYRGIRAPHKLKMAVSGCTRECAEAQGKDVGVIATEKGYNLYVGGNGGMTPRHAELLASDVDEETLIRYVDRFLMFYIKSADRLQRTARWIENLEGGLDHVREVVVEDKLGLGPELERQMQYLVDTYACEWKKALESPETLQRFRTFVNEESGDDSLEYVRERGQRRPAYAHERGHKRLEVIS